MVSSENDGGVGGKFRRRPFRRAPATPYDRPQTALRRADPNPNPNNLIGGNNGWISKIVVPASRIVARGASKFFGSVFQKRLTGSHSQLSPPPEENLLPGHRALEAARNNLQMQKPSEKAPEQDGVNVGDNVANLYNTDGCQQETPSGRDGFIELEQLLKKKTFTRVEFDRLTDLLRSRTVEPSTSKQPVDYENKEETVVTEEAQYKTQSIVEPNTSQLVFNLKTKENIIISEQEDKTKSSSLHRNIKDSAVNLHVRGQPFQIPEEEAVSPTELAKEYMGSRPSKVSPSTLNLRSQMLQEDTTLSTEPYPKNPSMALLASRSSIHSSRIAEHSENSYMTPRSRGRSALYKMSRSSYFNVHKTANIRGGRPVRDGLASSSMSSPLGLPNMLPSGKKVLKRGSAVLDSDVGSFGPIRRIRQKSDLMSPSERLSSPRNLLPSLTAPLHQDVNERSASATQKTTQFPFAGVTPVPPQSTEMARKILLELDKLVPSPREKLSEKKASGSRLPSLRSSISPKHDRIKDNSPSENAVSAVKATDEVVGMGSPVTCSPVTSSTDVRSSRKIADTTTVSDSAALPSKEEPSFQMTMAEKKSLEWGAKYNMSSASGLSSSGNDKLLGKSVASHTKSLPASSSMLKREADVKASDRPATEKRVDFMLSPVPALGSQSQPSPTPDIPSSLADSSVTKKEISAPASASEGLSTMNPICGSVSMKVGASATPRAGTIIESSGLDRGGKTQKAGDLYKSFQNATSSGSSTSTSAVLFTSGASPGPSQSNGSLTSFSSFPVSAGSAAAYFGNISTTANSSTQSVLGAQPVVASTTLFQFGSGLSTGAPISFPVSGDKSDAGDADGKSVKTSPFAISSSVATGTSNVFSNTNITASSSVTSSVFSSIGGISSSPATSSSLLLNAASGSSLLTASSAFPSPLNGIFGFSASEQSSIPSSSLATNSFSNSGSHFVGTAGSTFGAQPSQLGSGTTSFPDSTGVQGSSFSSGPTFGLNSSSTLNSVTSPFGDATSVGKPFSSHTGFSPAAAGSSTPASIPSFPPIASSSLFSSNTQSSSSAMFPSTSGTNPSLPSTGFVFGSPAPPSGKTVGASSGTVFSFSSVRTSTSAASPSPAQPVSNIPMQSTGFGSSSPGDDRMNVEDAMVDDSIQASAPSLPAFGQPANSLPTPSLQFGTPAASSGGASVFPFGGNQNSPIPQNPFQSAGSFEFSAGGSFSLGSGAGDKSGRRIVRVKRDKHRKK